MAPHHEDSPARLHLVPEHTCDLIPAEGRRAPAVAGDLVDLSDEQWRRTFAVHVDSFFHVTKAALAHLPRGAAIVNTASINGLRGNKNLIDYSATKGAVLVTHDRDDRDLPHHHRTVPVIGVGQGGVESFEDAPRDAGLVVRSCSSHTDRARSQPTIAKPRRPHVSAVFRPSI